MDSDAVITADKKKDLNDRIDANIPDIGFGDRVNALLQFLRYFEKEAAGLSMLGKEHSRDADVSLAMDAADYCLQWLARLPEDPNESVSMISSSDDLNECQRVFGIALNYTSMCELMTILFQDLLTVSEISSGAYRFVHKTELAHQLEVSEWLLRKLKVPQESEQVPALDIARLERDIDRGKITGQSILKHVNQESFQYVFDWMSRVYSRDWELPGTMVLDGFMLDDFRQFWIALRTLASITTYVSRNPGVAGQILYASTVPVVTKAELVEYIASVSGLNPLLIATLVDYFTFDLCNNLQRRPHASLQPIFPLGSNQLALSSVFILESNVERNVFDLLNIKNEKRYDKLKDLKEEEWSNQLIDKLIKDGLVAKPQMKYAKTKQGETKLDLIAIDLHKKIGLVFELKWQLGGGFIKAHHREYLRVGFGQAQRACDWVCNNLALTEEKLGLPKDSLKGVEFHPILVAKETLMNGHVQDETVPLICGRLLDWVLKKTNSDLTALWYVASERSYLPQKGVHFGEESREIPPFNGIVFIQPKTIKGRKEWNPDTDIPFRKSRDGIDPGRSNL